MLMGGEAGSRMQGATLLIGGYLAPKVLGALVLAGAPRPSGAAVRVSKFFNFIGLNFKA